MATRAPIAFMSYVRSDDEHEIGRLTTFRERLGAEVRFQTGGEFRIFQDRKDIQWGQNWKKRIEESIDEVSFLIPIVTPSFFNSRACRDEVERFLVREKELGRDDLILPVYYLGCPVLDDEKKRAADKIAQAIAAHQYADWRELRFEPFTSPQIGRTLAKLAEQIRDALARAPAKTDTVERPPRKARARARERSPSTAGAVTDEPSLLVPEGTESATEGGQAGPVISAKTEPPTRIVDAMHRGDHSTITEAIEAADPGDRILVHPGLYDEGLVIDKPLEIIGEGDLGEVVVQATGQHTLLFKANMGRVANLSLRQMGGGDFYGVDIAQRRLELEGCDITSQSYACIAIHGGADPRLRRNRIHDGKERGIVVHDDGQGTLEDNDIFGNDLSGVHIKSGGNPTLRRNRIHDGKQGGVFVYDNGLGTLEDNDISGNGLTGVEITTGGNPTVRRNRIHDGKRTGVVVYENGQGTLEDNDISGNAYAGVEIREGGNPTLRRNRINRNGYEAVWVHKGGGRRYV